MSRFEVFQDSRTEYRWRLKAGNGEIVATSEGYTSRANAHESAQKLKVWANSSDPIVDL